MLFRSKYRTDFEVEGSSNYAFNLVLKEPDFEFRDRLEKTMDAAGIEFRRGSAGGGNQLRQHYLKGIVGPDKYKEYPETEYIHHFAYYVGNYPTLEADRVIELCNILNAVE